MFWGRGAFRHVCLVQLTLCWHFYFCSSWFAFLFPRSLSGSPSEQALWVAGGERMFRFQFPQFCKFGIPCQSGFLSAIHGLTICGNIECLHFFQVVFLQYLYGPNVKILPLLCGSFGRSIYLGGPPENSDEVRRYLDAARDPPLRRSISDVAGGAPRSNGL